MLPNHPFNFSFSLILFLSVDQRLYSITCELFMLVNHMVRNGVNTERSWGFYVTVLVTIGLIAGIFLWPLTFSTAISVSDMPSIIIFISIMMFTLIGCGLPDRERPHFQFHYHGEEFPVMSELQEEIMD